MKLKLSALAVIATAMFATGAFAKEDVCEKNPTHPLCQGSGGGGGGGGVTPTSGGAGGAGGVGVGVGVGVGLGIGTGGSVLGSGNSTNTIGAGVGNFSPSAEAKIGNVTSSATGGNASATGGAAGTVSVGGFGNSVKSLSPEANSTNINTNLVAPVAKGGNANQKQGQSQGQNQQQGQQQTTAVTNSGNNTGNSTVSVGGQSTTVGGQTATNTTTVGGQSTSLTINNVDPNSAANAKTAADAARDVAAQDAAARVAAANATAEAIRQAAKEPIKNTPSMDAPALTSSNDTCMGSISGSIAMPGFGIGAGTTMIDENCVMLKNSRELWNMGMKAASLARMCMDDKNREALEITGYVCPPVKAKKDAETKKAAAAEAKTMSVYAGN